MKISQRFGPHQVWLFGAPNKKGWLKVSPEFVQSPIFASCLKLMELSVIETRREYQRYADLLLVTGEKLVPVPEGCPVPTYFIEIRDLDAHFDVVTDANGLRRPRLTRGRGRMFSLKLERNHQAIWNVVQPLMAYEQNAHYEESDIPF